ncbi:MAG: PLP-dependent aminotransferase family protein [Peptococcaceae bacterium]|nr:PLP-dependent aminotransferase family protein [Peptococcaceae bacterium]
MPVNSFDDYPMNWTPILTKHTGTIYTVLADQLTNDIRCGHLKPGDKLPPQRELADYLDVHLSTITRAYKLCEERGLICAKVGQGTFVASDVNTSDILLYPQENNPLIQMGTILPPYDDNEKVIAFIRTLLLQPDIKKFLEYGSPTGTFAQRQNAAHFLKHYQVTAQPHAILFATGAQNALCATLLALFHPGDRIGASALCFSGLKAIAKMIGIHLIPLPEKNGKLDLDTLSHFCRSEHLKGIYLIPDHHNPTTYTLTLDERQTIAKIAHSQHLILIEDAINLLFAETLQKPLQAYAPEQTIFIFSTAKFLSPGLRTAMLIAPEQFRNTLEAALYNMNLMVSPLNLEIVCRLMTTPLLTELIDARRKALYQRNQLVQEYLHGFDISGEATCLFRWLQLPSSIDCHTLEQRAKENGLQLFAADRFALGKTQPPNAVRLAISSPKTIKELEQGLTRLRTLLT